MLKYLRLYFIFLIYFQTCTALSASISISTITGSMMQPTSSYHHASYGTEIEGQFFSKALQLKSTYVERPKFRSSGFVDQDYGYFFQIGTKTNKNKDHDLNAFLGYGYMQGYIATDNDIDDKTKRTFSIPGPVYSLDYRYNFNAFSIGLNHTSLIGLKNNEQVSARVGWPYNFFLIKISYTYGKS